MTLQLPDRVQARVARLTNSDHVLADMHRPRISAPLITAGKNKASVETTDEDAEPGIVFSGFATVFDTDSEIYWGMYRMRIKRGAFKDCLASAELDARFMINHGGLSFARTTNGTLELEEKPRGLWHRARVADVAEMQTLATLVERGDMDQMSFAAYISEDEWETCDCEPDEVCECIWTRHIHSFSALDEVSVVTFPAIAATSVDVTRASEDPGERNTPASDGERRDSTAPGEASTSVDASDPNGLNSLWLWALERGVSLNGSGDDSQRSAA